MEGRKRETESFIQFTHTYSYNCTQIRTSCRTVQHTKEELTVFQSAAHIVLHRLIIVHCTHSLSLLARVRTHFSFILCAVVIVSLLVDWQVVAATFSFSLSRRLSVSACVCVRVQCLFPIFRRIFSFSVSTFLFHFSHATCYSSPRRNRYSIIRIGWLSVVNRIIASHILCLFIVQCRCGGSWWMVFFVVVGWFGRTTDQYTSAT